MGPLGRTCPQRWAFGIVAELVDASPNEGWHKVESGHVKTLISPCRFDSCLYHIINQPGEPGRKPREDES